MEQYYKTGALKAVICNRCGRKQEVKGSFPKFDYLEGKKEWGYFSRKDGEIHLFHLCEDCYDWLVREFQIPVQVEEKTVL